MKCLKIIIKLPSTHSQTLPPHSTLNYACSDQLLLQFSGQRINLFINSDAILNRDALWSIQGKKQYLQAATLEEYTIQEKYCDEYFLNYNWDMSVNFLSISYRHTSCYYHLLLIRFLVASRGYYI